MRYRYILNGQTFSYECEPSFDAAADIVVAGLGTAGVIAAYKAADSGAAVIGVERGNCVCGQGGQAGVSDYYYGTRGGVSETLNQLCQNAIRSGAYRSSRRPDAPEESIPPSVKAYLAEKELLKRGASLWFDSQIIGLYMEDNTVKGMKCLHGDRTVNVACRVVIDATGEGDIAHLAGCRSLPNRWMDDGNMTFSRTNTVLVREKWLTGSWASCGRTKYGDADGFSDALLDALTLPYEQRRDTPERRVVYEGALPGIREGRRIRCIDHLDFGRFMNGEKTDHPVFYASSIVDSVDYGTALEDDALQDYRIMFCLGHAKITVPVPMGALIPEDAENLLMAGKCMGMDHDFAACVRMKRDMEKSGEAAAVIALRMVNLSCAAREVPYGSLVGELTESGCLDLSQDEAWELGPKWRETGIHEKIVFPDTDEQIREGLSASEPGYALWSVRKKGKCMIPLLTDWLESGDGTLADNSALALGLLGDRRALPRLRAMSYDLRQGPLADRWSPYCPNALKAITLIGRLADEESLDRLCEIMLSDSCMKTVEHKPDLFQPTPEDYYMNLFLHALCAARRILEVHPAKRTEIKEKLIRRVCDGSFSAVHSFTRIDLTGTVRDIVSAL